MKELNTIHNGLKGKQKEGRVPSTLEYAHPD